jgi:hypothetical protein
MEGARTAFQDQHQQTAPPTLVQPLVAMHPVSVHCSPSLVVDWLRVSTLSTHNARNGTPDQGLGA